MSSRGINIGFSPDLKTNLDNDSASGSTETNTKDTTTVNAETTIIGNTYESVVGHSSFSVKSRQPKPEVKHSSYYLKLTTVNNIDKYHKKLGMNKSEFVNSILEEFFKNFKMD